MKIAYFINQYPKVSHSFIRREILALEAQGFDIQRIALRGWDETLPDPIDRQELAKTRFVLRGGLPSLLLPGARVAVMAPGRFLNALRLATRISASTDHRLLHHWVCVLEACSVLRWVRENETQHVHAHFGTNSAEVVMYTRLLGGPTYSFTIHGPREFVEPLALDQKVHHAKFAVAISSFGRSQVFMRTLYPDWSRIHIVRCGIDGNFYREESAAAPSRRFVCIGRLTEAKGQLLLIEAAAQLMARGIDVEVTIAGDGPMRAILEQQIQLRQLTGRIRITGWISGDQVRQELLAARALVLPSFAEGLPVVIMEAFSLRKPVLTTFIAGIPELVEHKVNGWLFPAGSVDRLASAMQECLASSDEEMSRMGNEGFARVIKYHSIETEAARLAVLIRTSEVGGAAA